LSATSKPAAPDQSPITAASLRARKPGGDKIVVVTAYDVAFARLADSAGIDVVLVGDSLGMVVQGQPTTLAVTLDEMIYHARAVMRGVSRVHVCVDLPFMSYQVSVEDGLRAAGRVLKESGAHAVKVEGGSEVAPLITRLTQAGVPVMGHVGLTPQSFHQMGGFRVQGRTDPQKAKILEGARAVSDAGAYAIVLEGMPAPLAAEITAELPIPTIGIGAGVGCDGQVLVMHDLLGLDVSWSPKFARRYAELGREVEHAFSQYVDDVRRGLFPNEGESFK
jgi:3-methyl-2-oxobutanoate hydroxymethyltransferase